MKIRILGAGWYGCHIASILKENPLVHVEVHDIAKRIFDGASGANPARLHQGQHYPRSSITRKHCRSHHQEFMHTYGHLTSCVPINLYAIAEYDSLVDFGNYIQVLKDEIQFIEVHDPKEFGLQHVEGAIMTGERHVIIERARKHFEELLSYRFKPEMSTEITDENEWDWTIDCTFCAHESAGIDRYEPCITTILEGPTDRAVTIMDGQFPSIYPWNEEKNLSSLTSAKYTPIDQVETWQEARHIIDTITENDKLTICNLMHNQIKYFWPAAEEYKFAGYRMGIRAMQKSNSDARIMEVVQISDKVLRVRAGKIDAVINAGKIIKDRILPNAGYFRD